MSEIEIVFTIKKDERGLTIQAKSNMLEMEVVAGGLTFVQMQETISQQFFSISRELSKRGLFPIATT